MSAPRRFLSVCSGIEAASVAFQPLGWEAVAVAEIEPFPCAVLAHRYGASRPWHMPLPHTPAERLAIVHLSTPWVSWALMDALNKAAAPFEAAIKAVRTLPDPATATLPNLGDLTRWREWPVELLEEADGLCGGTPCQGFSVAGLRGSLDDERGNLTLTFCHLYDRLDEIRHAAGRPPAVCLWENVPGVFSTHDNAFGCLLAGLAGEDVPLEPPGGKWTDAGAVRGPRRAVAWRVLDAQYCGLAQRRKRVFVVASADPAFDPVAVLFEFGGLRRDSAPSRGEGEGTAHDVAPCLTSGGRGVERTGETRGQDPVVAVKVLSAQCSVVAGPLTTRPYADNASQEGRLVPEVAGTLNANGKAAGSATRGSVDGAAGIVPTEGHCHGDQQALIRILLALNANRGCHNPGDFEAGTLLVENATAHTLRGEGFDASEGGTGPIAFSGRERGDDGRGYTRPPPHCVAVAEPAAWKVRRLTPEECEILQGFPVGYTLIPGTSSRRRKGADLSDTIDYLISLGVSAEQAATLAHSPDGPRYKALGNSWAVPVARWIGARIEAMLSTARAE